MVAPTAKPAFRFTVCPNEWNSGRVSRWVSCWLATVSKSRLLVIAFITMLEWVSSAPFGCPVVPLV